jgi:DNA-directed RNA polymerase specialized sigma subunit
MADTITEDQIVQAAQELGKDEFTRLEIAEKLGVDREELQPAFKAAREGGRLERVDETDEGKPRFRLTGK